MNNKAILAILIVLLIIFGAGAIYLGIQLSQAPSELPQTGSDPNTICDTETQNNGYLFICNAIGDGQLFSCQDRQYHSANFAHACAQIITPDVSCSGLTNYGAGPWESDPNRLNFVGCYYGTGIAPQNCYCPSYPGGTTQCYTDTFASGNTYDSCGARYFQPAATTVTPTLTNTPSVTPTVTTTVSISVPVTVPGTTTPPATTIPPTTPPATTAVPTASPSGTVIPKTALISDGIDRMIIGTVLFLIGAGFLASGKFINLGTMLTDLVNGKTLFHLKLNLKKQKSVAERNIFEEKFS